MVNPSRIEVRLNIFGAAAVIAAGLAVAIITSSLVASRAYRAKVNQSAAAGREITVKGYARQRVTADLAAWDITIQGEGATLDHAYRSLENAQVRVENFLDEYGFTSEVIGKAAIKTDTHHLRDEAGRATRKVEGYTLSRQITVATSDIAMVESAAGGITALIKDGVFVISSQPRYTISSLGTIKHELIGQAAGDARLRADKIASESGAEIASVRSARQGVIQITRPNSTAVSSYGLYDTSTIKKDIAIVVTVTFALVPE